MKEIAEQLLATPPVAHRLAEGHNRLQRIFSFINLSPEVVAARQYEISLSRAGADSQLLGRTFSKDQLKSLLGHEHAPLDEAEHLLSNYHQTEVSLYNHLTNPSTASLLAALQSGLYPATPQAGSNLFSAGFVQDNGPAAEHVEQSGLPWLLHSLANTSDADAWQQGWLLHYFVAVCGPYSEKNSQAARLLHHHWLVQHHLCHSSLLCLNHTLSQQSNEYHALIGETTGTISSRFTAFLQFGLQQHHLAQQSLEDMLRELFRQRTDYDRLQPRLRNAVNFAFEHGCRCALPADKEYNQRQQEIMYILYRQGVVQTKELFPQFDCNRKTIQRDFNELAEIGVAKVVGEGRGLRYVLPVAGRVPAEFEPLQAGFARTEHN